MSTVPLGLVLNEATRRYRTTERDRHTEAVLTAFDAAYQACRDVVVLWFQQKRVEYKLPFVAGVRARVGAPLDFPTLVQARIGERLAYPYIRVHQTAYSEAACADDATWLDVWYAFVVVIYPSREKWIEATC
jgi:hypothetical protein